MTNKNKEIHMFFKNINEGLSSVEVEERKNSGLINKKKSNSSIRTYFQIIVKNVFTFFNILLFIIGAILIIFQKWNSCVFLIILILNLTISLYQDIKSKMLVDKLNLIRKDKYKVIRNGKEELISIDELVLDDIVKISTNEQIPCDSEVVYGECRVDESILTGESDPSFKKIGDNLYGGSYIVNGEIYLRINKVGKDNYIDNLEEKAKKCKFQKSEMYVQLNYLFKIIGLLVIIIGIADIVEFIFLSKPAFDPIDYSYNFKLVGETIVGPLAGALISLIPSGLYLLASTSLSVGSINLLKNKVIVQDMYSIETLARMDVLCIDKTGTITDGTMKVYDFVVNDKVISEGKLENYIANLNYFLKDTNFTALALKEKFSTAINLTLTFSSPFDSKKKYSIASFKEGTIGIGAYGFLPIKKDKKTEKLIESFTSKGLRVLTVGYSPLTYDGIENIELEYAGLIIIQDTIRKNVKEIIGLLQKTGVKVKVISGDNSSTVKAICDIVEIEGSDKYISLEGMSDEEVIKAAKNYNIFGRVSPEQKELIIKTLKEEKLTVGMFGDGINDVLSLKQASVSITINNASKAAQNISNFVIIDNDFRKIPEIIKQGRRVINNLERTCALFLVKTIFSLFMNTFFAIFGIVNNVVSGEASLWPFLPNNFYAWEILAIGAPSFFLALEPNDEPIKGSFLMNTLKQALPNGLVMGFIVMYVFINNTNKLDVENLRTISTFFISICGLLILFNVCRKFNLYRSLVFGGSLIFSIILFVWSIYGKGDFNWLALNGDIPRFISDNELNILIEMLGAFMIVMIFMYFINLKERDNKNEKEN